jgi:mono/diheme cytochrome c family protein
MSERSWSTLRLLILLACGVSATTVTSRSQTASPGQARTDSAGDVERGRLSYLKYGCDECHGAEGQGSTTGPRLGPNPLPLAGFTRYVRQPKQQMPPYTGKVLPDADAQDIHAFLRARPKPPAVETIDLLK